MSLKTAEYQVGEGRFLGVEVDSPIAGQLREAFRPVNS